VAGASKDKPAPTVLMGPGWGSAGDTNTAAPGVLGAVSIHTLADHGYNVLTWDPRGFGASTGNAEVDSPAYEARDVEQLIDWVAARPEAQLDGQRDPRMGMVGGSYGGGIQFVTAAQDCRIDAIVPIIAWHSLGTSLFKADTPKTGWATLLIVAAASAHLDPTIKHANDIANATGSFEPADAKFFTDRGPGDLVSKIHVPTLIIQGTVDTLFTLDEAVSNYQLLQAAGTKVAMVWYCGGHGVCLTKPGDSGLVGNTATAWLDRYVKGDSGATAVPGFEFVDQDGTLHTTDAYPSATGSTVTASGTGTLQLVATGGSGPSTAKPAEGGIVSTAALSICPAKATNAVNVSIAAPSNAVMLVGAPELKLAYTGTAGTGNRPTRVFAQIVDDSSGLVLGNQITPIDVTLDGLPHALDVKLEMIAHRFAPGATLTLQLVATTVGYAQPQLGGSVKFAAIDVSLPVLSGVTPAA
jgi:ABC-2 type transport system ATP-binding protein